MPAREDKHQPKIATELLQATSEGGAFFTQTVAMEVWSGVNVTQKISTGMSIFDRFTLECLIQLGSCCKEDLCEVIGVSDDLARWWLEWAQTKGLASQVGESIFVPNVDLCVDALKSNATIEHKDAEKTMLWFAQTSELVMLSPQDPMIRKLSKIEPTARYPLPADTQGKSRGEIIEESMANSLLYGSEAESIVAVADTKTLGSDSCPAYQLEVDLEKVNSANTKVRIGGYPARKGGHRDKKRKELISQTVSIPSLRYFNDASLTIISSISNSLCDAMERDGLIDPAMLETSCQATLDYEKARDIAPNDLLDCNKRILFTVDNEMEYEISITLVPSNDKVSSLINLDTAVRAFISKEVSAEVVDEICNEFDVIPKDVLFRLWQLKQYAAIYQLREKRDFTE